MLGVIAAEQKDLLHAGVREKLECVLDQWRVGEREETSWSLESKGQELLFEGVCEYLKCDVNFA